MQQPTTYGEGVMRGWDAYAGVDVSTLVDLIVLALQSSQNDETKLIGVRPMTTCLIHLPKANPVKLEQLNIIRCL